jgi:prephenate dehydrogenase
MKHITIIGCGLIGGSFAALVKKYHSNNTILGIGRRTEPLKQAVKKGLIDQFALDINAEQIEQTDMVVLATPISTILPMIETLNNLISKSLIIIDFSSVKSFLNDPIVTSSHHKIVPLHPMGGRDVQGLDYAASDVLENCPLITFDRNSNSEINAFFSQCSFKLIHCKSYKEHDEWMANISHGPYLIASLIPILLSQKEPSELRALSEVSAGGFRDTTRVSNSAIEWGMDILAGNKIPLLSFLNDIERTIGTLKRQLENDQYTVLEQTLKTAKKTRQIIVNDT